MSMDPKSNDWCVYRKKKGHRDGEESHEIRMGNTCKSMADSFQCMTKPTTIKKKKSHEKLGTEIVVMLP